MENIICARSNQRYAFTENDMGFLLMLQVRDEAHRFALYGHRKKREASGYRSTLEAVEGVGIKRREKLIRFFGGIQGVKEASITDLMKVAGIHRALAEKIYYTFHMK